MKTTNVFLNSNEQIVKIDSANAKTVHKRLNEKLFDTLHNMLMGDIDRVELNIHTNRYVTNEFGEKDKYQIIKHTVNNPNRFLNYNPLYHLSYDDYKVHDDRKSRKVNNDLRNHILKVSMSLKFKDSILMVKCLDFTL